MSPNATCPNWTASWFKYQQWRTLVFSVRPGLNIQLHFVCVCVCVYTVIQDTPPQHVSPSMLLKLAARSCRRGMRPGREPHRNNNSPHQRSSIDGTWLSTFILWVYESSLHPSITHWHGEGREKRRWFAKDKLTTNWSLTHVFHLVFLSSFDFFPFYG